MVRWKKSHIFIVVLQQVLKWSLETLHNTSFDAAEQGLDRVLFYFCATSRGRRTESGLSLEHRREHRIQQTLSRRKKSIFYLDCKFVFALTKPSQV